MDAFTSAIKVLGLNVFYRRELSTHAWVWETFSFQRKFIDWHAKNRMRQLRPHVLASWWLFSKDEGIFNSKKNPELRRSGRCMWHSVWHTPCRTLRATSRTPHLAALMLNFTHTHTHTQIDETVRHWLYFLVLCISSEVLDCQIVSISYTISSLTWWNITRHIDKLSINWRRASSYIRSKNPVLLFALDVFWDIKPKYAVCDSHICSCVSLNVEQNKRDSVTTLSDDIDDSK